jgi:multiple sugar transport system permease protein
MTAYNLLRGGLVATALAFFTTPVLFLLSLSFKTKDDVLSGDFLPNAVTFSNWPDAFSAAHLATFLGNSVLVALLSGVITLLITVPAIYGVTRQSAGGAWLPDVTLSSFMAPPIVAIIPFFYLLKWIGLLNTQAGIALVYGLVNVPVAFWLLTPFFKRVPPEIEQAAALDGAGPVRTLVSVIIPMIAPGLAATAVIIVILSYNEFLFASVFTTADATRTLPVGVSLFQGDRLVNFGQMAAASLTGILPVYLAALFLQKYLIQGLAHGAVK